METNTPFFSIIIPVYNTVKELRRCVESITCQTYGDFEIILVDDGSTDGSGALCDTLAGEDPRILCIHKENGGCSEARNTGIRTAQGKYLLFVDSDDLWDDAKALMGVFTALQQNSEPEVLCFGTAIYDEDGTLVKKRCPSMPAENTMEKYTVLQQLVYTNQYISAIYVKAVSRCLVLENSLFFRRDLTSGEDIDWSARLMLCCSCIAVYPVSFYRRIRRFEGAITSAIGKKNILDVLSAIEEGIGAAANSTEAPSFLALYYEYWAYQYAMLLGLAQRISGDAEFPQILARLKALQWLLRYDHVKKVKAVHWLVSVLGLKSAMFILGKYYSRK